MKRVRDAQAGDVAKAKQMARHLIEAHLKTKPQRVTYQAGGLTNFVFLVQHGDGDFVVRLGQDLAKINAYIKEQWAVNRARKAGVPTSEILEVGNEVVAAPYMISRRAQGQIATHHPNRLAILRELGKYTARINSIRTSGFGNVFDWSNNQLSRNETWKEFLHQELKIEARLDILEKYKMIRPSKVRELAVVLEKGSGKNRVAALNHGDVRLKNVLVDRIGKITALIDWENCMSNLTPHWDLSIALHDLSIDEKTEFLAGYGLSGEEILKMTPLIKALNLINYVPYIQRSIDASDTARLDKYRLRLSGALDLYSL